MFRKYENYKLPSFKMLFLVYMLKANVASGTNITQARARSCEIVVVAHTTISPATSRSLHRQRFVCHAHAGGKCLVRESHFLTKSFLV